MRIEPLVPQLSPSVSIVDWVANLSTFAGTLSTHRGVPDVIDALSNLHSNPLNRESLDFFLAIPVLGQRCVGGWVAMALKVSEVSLGMDFLHVGNMHRSP